MRNVWLGHDLETRTKRLMHLEKAAQETTLMLSEEQKKLLERPSADFRCRHNLRRSHHGYRLVGRTPSQPSTKRSASPSYRPST